MQSNLNEKEQGLVKREQMLKNYEETVQARVCLTQAMKSCNNGLVFLLSHSYDKRWKAYSLNKPKEIERRPSAPSWVIVQGSANSYLNGLRYLLLHSFAYLIFVKAWYPNYRISWSVARWVGIQRVEKEKGISFFLMALYSIYSFDDRITSLRREMQ